MSFDWTCPHCNYKQIVSDGNLSTSTGYLSIGKSKYNEFCVQTLAIRCLNAECNDIFLRTAIVEAKQNYQGGPWVATENIIRAWTLIPDGQSKPQPEYVPRAIREDYYEACKIRDLSPKASATLSRRCLQGMIRDFCGITKPTLNKEIEELRRKINSGEAPNGVTMESVDAIDHIRSIGNIGAHMEKDINIIIDVDSDEAAILIATIETLIEDWYISREKRAARLRRLEEIAREKAEAKSLPAPITPRSP